MQKRLFLSDQSIDVREFIQTGDDEGMVAIIFQALHAGMADVIQGMQAEGFTPDPQRLPSIVMTFQAPAVKGGANDAG